MLSTLRRELAKPALTSWVAEARADRGDRPTPDIDIEALMDDVRSEGA